MSLSVTREAAEGFLRLSHSHNLLSEHYPSERGLQLTDQLGEQQSQSESNCDPASFAKLLADVLWLLWPV